MPKRQHFRRMHRSHPRRKCLRVLRQPGIDTQREAFTEVARNRVGLGQRRPRQRAVTRFQCEYVGRGVRFAQYFRGAARGVPVGQQHCFGVVFGLGVAEREGHGAYALRVDMRYAPSVTVKRGLRPEPFRVRGRGARRNRNGDGYQQDGGEDAHRFGCPPGARSIPGAPRPSITNTSAVEPCAPERPRHEKGGYVA